MTSAPQNKRIGAIDSVRAVILLGILLVHTANGFGFNLILETSDVLGMYLQAFTYLFLSNKCAVVFSVLFGVSFYFILKKPEYPAIKFVWRCVLLFAIGLVNKLFYTYDALCWYAVWGIVLASERKMKPATLLVTAIFLKIAAIIISNYSIGDIIFPNEYKRYDLSNPFWNILVYPYAMQDYLRVVFNRGVLDCLSNFTLGFWLARCGVIERLKELVTLRWVIFTFFVFTILFICNHKFIRVPVLGLSAGLFYASLIIYFYYNVKCIHRVLHYLESYGRLGLTNYSCQGIFGVALFSCFGQELMSHGYFYVVLVMLFFYSMQTVFSYQWLRKHKYGPLEYLWRSFTDMKFSGNTIGR